MKPKPKSTRKTKPRSKPERMLWRDRERFVSVRFSLGLTQQEAADRIGVHRVTLAKWETGTPPRGLYLKAVEAFLAGK